MEKLEVGDVVLLKSGGPKMTIEIIGDYSMFKGIDNGAYCTWFDGNEKKGEVFDIRAIKKMEEI